MLWRAYNRPRRGAFPLQTYSLTCAGPFVYAFPAAEVFALHCGLNGTTASYWSMMFRAIASQDDSAWNRHSHAAQSERLSELILTASLPVSLLLEIACKACSQRAIHDDISTTTQSSPFVTLVGIFRQHARTVLLFREPRKAHFKNSLGPLVRALALQNLPKRPTILPCGHHLALLYTGDPSSLEGSRDDPGRLVSGRCRFLRWPPQRRPRQSSLVAPSERCRSSNRGQRRSRGRSWSVPLMQRRRVCGLSWQKRKQRRDRYGKTAKALLRRIMDMRAIRFSLARRKCCRRCLGGANYAELKIERLWPYACNGILKLTVRDSIPSVWCPQSTALDCSLI